MASCYFLFTVSSIAMLLIVLVRLLFDLTTALLPLLPAFQTTPKRTLPVYWRDGTNACPHAHMGFRDTANDSFPQVQSSAQPIHASR